MSFIDMNNLPSDREAIEAMLIDIQAEIDDITAQLAEVEIGDDDDQAWQGRALAARNVRFKARAALTAKLAKMDKAQADAEVAGPRTELALIKLEARRLQTQAAAANVEAARIAAERREKNIERANSETRVKFRAAMDWLKVNEPDVWGRLVDHLQTVEAEIATKPEGA